MVCCWLHSDHKAWLNSETGELVGQLDSSGQPVDKTQATLQRVCDNCHKLQCDLQRDAAQAQPQREPEPEAWLPRLSSLPSAVTGIAAYGITAPFMWLKGGAAASDPSRRSHWAPDAAISQCQFAGCGLQFSSFRRRHHCRKCGGIFCGGHSRHRIPLAKSYAALYRAAAEEGADPRHHRVCDVCHGEYRNALRKYSGTEALAHTFKVYQELSSYLLSTVEAVCGEEAAKLLGNLPGSSGTHLHDFVRLYADDLWPALKKDYEGGPGAIPLKRYLDACHGWRRKLEGKLMEPDFEVPAGHATATGPATSHRPGSHHHTLPPPIPLPPPPPIEPAPP
eukprot:EG_transcript_15249